MSRFRFVFPLSLLWAVAACQSSSAGSLDGGVDDATVADDAAAAPSGAVAAARPRPRHRRHGLAAGHQGVALLGA